MLSRLLVVLALLLAPGAALAWPKAGKPAPRFTVVGYDGQEISSDSLRGKVVILNYWATWCGPCRREIPEIDSYVRRHRGAPLAVYAITLDNEVPYARLRFLGDTLKFPLMQKLKGGAYGAIKGAVPTNYVIDKAGMVRYAASGTFDMETLERTVTPLLSEAEPARPQAAAVAAATREAGGR